MGKTITEIDQIVQSELFQKKLIEDKNTKLDNKALKELIEGWKKEID